MIKLHERKFVLDYSEYWNTQKKPIENCIRRQSISLARSPFAPVAAAANSNITNNDLSMPRISASHMSSFHAPGLFNNSVIAAGGDLYQKDEINLEFQ